MATISQIRGALLEEAVLYLLAKVGYKIIRHPTDSIDPTDLRPGHSGLELEGRGAWHQIDAVAEQHQSQAFTYPLRLLVEAKCYEHSRVGIPIIRNAVGVHKDISENYFSKHRSANPLTPIRFNYQSAIFSTSGYTQPAIEYAVAHQIFLIEYNNIPIIAPIVRAIQSITENSLINIDVEPYVIRNIFRSALDPEDVNIQLDDYFSETGLRLINDIQESITNIRGSYFGMLQGRWPLHLLTSNPLPPAAFVSDVVRCELHGAEHGAWGFVPTDVDRNSEEWFELQFYLPVELVRLIQPHWGDPFAIANAKSQNFSYIVVTGMIGEILRTVRIELDREWLNNYLLSLL